MIRRHLVSRAKRPAGGTLILQNSAQNNHKSPKLTSDSAFNRTFPTTHFLLKISKNDDDGDDEEEEGGVVDLENDTAAFFHKRVLLLVDESVDETVFAVVLLDKRHHFLDALRHGLPLDVAFHPQLLYHLLLRGYVRRHDDDDDDDDTC